MKELQLKGLLLVALIGITQPTQALYFPYWGKAKTWPETIGMMAAYGTIAYASIYGTIHGLYKIYSNHRMEQAPKELANLVAFEHNSNAHAIEIYVKNNDITGLRGFYEDSPWPLRDAWEALHHRIYLYNYWIKWIYESKMIIDEQLASFIHFSHHVIDDYQEAKRILAIMPEYSQEYQAKKQYEIQQEQNHIQRDILFHTTLRNLKKR